MIMDACVLVAFVFDLFVVRQLAYVLLPLVEERVCLYLCLYVF